jgi:radical SAM superfamily enzyme YgiQ (UPF0313 family)
MYKGKRFRVKSLDEIRDDIAQAKKRYGAVERIFLADGDALAMETGDLLAVLGELRQAFPQAERVSLYAGPKNILQKTDEELAMIYDAGVTLAYFGIESGDAQVLEEIKKGATPQEMAESGRKIRRTGIKLSATMILGLGGKERWREHALATADIASEINPEYLSALTLMVDKQAPLGRLVEKGEFIVPSPQECLVELKTLIENLDVDDCLFRSNHASNYLAVGGRLPGDRENMVKSIERALGDKRLLKDEMFRGL